MKTTIIKQNKISILVRWVGFCLFILSFVTSKAQIQNNSDLFIGDNGYVYLGSDNYYFGTLSGQTKTTRTPLVYGKLIFSSVASSLGASATHYLDGYGSVTTTSSFIFPIGQTGVYAPAKVIPTTAAAIDAAYYRASASTISSTLDATVSGISQTEYWNIQGSNSAVISLTWSASSILTNIVNTTSDLTIVGFDGSKWIEISSTVDNTAILGGTSSLSSGSITSTSSVDLSTIKYFTIGGKGNSCPPLIASSGTTSTWNGAWSSIPTLADNVIINTPYSGGSFVCNSLVLNADITLSGIEYIEIVNGVTGTGKIIMSSNSSVVQRASGVTAPNIELTKKTRFMRQLDYVYWGTPIAGDFFSQIAGAQANNATVADAFDYKYKYRTGTGGGWQTLTAIETGLGFITRVKPQIPFTNATTTDFINFKFTGVANNGDITVPITNNLAALNGGTSHPLLANPYPSAIDANKFLAENDSIDGVLYIWTSSTASTTNGVNQYSQADYIAHTYAGTVIPNYNTSVFDGKIASGQGFRVKALQTGTVTFTNCMRTKDNNTQFYRPSQAIATLAPRDRFKLNMTGNNAVFSQILIAYLPEATLGYDRLYDAGRNSVSTAQLYSVFEGDGRKLAINARPNFMVSDVVPLGISKSDTTLENFTISITEKEGIFNSNAVSIFIHDKVLGTYFDLATGDYTFSSNTTTLNNRYEIVYVNGALATVEFDTTSVQATIYNNLLSIKSVVAMTNVELFDITGKKIYQSSIESALDFIAPFNQPQAIYIVKVKLEDGKMASFKLSNEK